jgi:two-component system alkaline phosphatase synthesis response regulator PhoP
MIKKLITTIEEAPNEVFTKSEILELINSFTQEQPMLQSNGITLNPNNNTVINQCGDQIYFPKKEFRLLFYLISKSNVCITRPNILRKIWGEEVCVGDRTIDVHIRKVKIKLGDHFQFIKTIKGIGYMWVEK